MKGYSRLNVLQVQRAKPGMLADGNGLYLQCTAAPAGTVNRSWLFRYTFAGRERWMGLGSAKDISLAEARAERDRCRRLLLDGQDPIEARRAKRAETAIATAKRMTFDDWAKAYMASRRASWSERHADQWESSLSQYVSPVFGGLPVAAIDTPLVMKVLQPLWFSRTETASRVRNRIEAVLDWAKTNRHRDGDNPARWKGHLANLLPARGKQQPGEHHAALPHDQIAGFMVRLRAIDSMPAAALEFTILTAARIGEVLGADWNEIDLIKRLWSVPPARTKTRIENHQVPLSGAAMTLLDRLAVVREANNLVFPGVGHNGRINQRTVFSVLQKMGVKASIHGFRATFRTWAQESTTFPDIVAEMALAHKVGSKVEQAYQRSTLLQTSRQLMELWADYCAGKFQASENVVAFPLAR
jgi:integrase